MTNIHCHICGLLLGEAAGEVEITCPLCLELRVYVKLALINCLPMQLQWNNAVHAMQQQTDYIIEDILQRRSIAIL